MPGWKPLIICGKTPPSGVTSLTGTVYEECQYKHVLELIQNAIHDIVLLSTLLFVIVLCIAGFRLLTSGGNTGALDAAKKMMQSVMWGYVWILIAWVVVYTITSALLNPGFSLLKG